MATYDLSLVGLNTGCSAPTNKGVRTGEQPAVRLGGEPSHGPQDIVDTGECCCVYLRPLCSFVRYRGG